MTHDASEPRIDLSTNNLEEVLRILRTYVPEYEVWAFGSRVNGSARTYSDLDLAVISREPLPLRTMADLKEAFDESDLAFKVDVVDWATTSEAFRNLIKKDKIVLHAGAVDAG